MAMALTRIPEASKAPANLYIHIKQNQIKHIWHGKQRHHVTLPELCTGCLDKLGAGVSFIWIKLTQT